MWKKELKRGLPKFDNVPENCMTSLITTWDGCQKKVFEMINNENNFELYMLEDWILFLFILY